MSLPPREHLARFATTSLVSRAGHRGLRVPLSARGLPAPQRLTMHRRRCRGPARELPARCRTRGPLVLLPVRGLPAPPRPRREPAPPLASRRWTCAPLAAIPGRQLVARFAACSVLPCARRSSPLALASGSRGWRPSHHVVLLRRAHGDGDEDDTTVTEVNGGA